MSQGQRVVLAGGGTAGHVEPALSVADALRRGDSDCEVTFLGTAEGLESRLVPGRGYRLETIPRVPLPRRPSAELISLPSRLNRAVGDAGAVLDRTRAQVLVGFGGYVAMPAYLAARRRHIPIVIHEANVRPGVANRIGARFARRVLVGFPGTRLPRAELVGLPLRRSISTLDRHSDREQARASLGLDRNRPTVLAFGGSLGAASLNRVVPALAPQIADVGAQVLLVAGTGRVDEAKANLANEAGGERLGQDAVRIVAYLDRMDLAYRAADVVVARAGAMTVAELTGLGMPSIFVPLPTGNGEQALNAAPVVAAGGAMMIADAELTADRLAAALVPVLTDHDLRRQMGERAAAFGRLDADEAIAAIVRQVASEATA